MTGDELKAWREGAGLTQGDAATALDMSRPTIARAEALGVGEVSSKIAKAVALLEVTPQANAPATGEPAKPPAPKASKDKAVPAHRLPREYDFAAAPDFTRGVKRLPDDNTKFGASGHHNLRPAGDGWQRVPGCIRIVSDRIKDPIPFEAPAWAGWRGQLTKSGAVFDYESGHPIHKPGASPQGRIVARVPFPKPEKKRRA